MESFKLDFESFYENNILGYIETLQNHPINLVMLIVDLVIVIFLLVNSFKMVKNTRLWQLIKGIIFLVLATWISGIFKLTILNYILTAIMNWGVLALIVIFQPELRRGLEQLGTSKFTRFFGLDKSIEVKTKENIYKIAIAAEELSASKTGA